MWRYPFGSGGKRVQTRPLYLLFFRSSTMMSRMKFPGAAAGAAVAASDTDFDVLMRANSYLNWRFAIRAIYETQVTGYSQNLRQSFVTAFPFFFSVSPCLRVSVLIF